MAGRADARAFLLFLDVGRTFRQPVDHGGEPAWRGEGPDLGEIETGGFQLVAEQARQVFARTGLHARRDFLGEQFEQELSHRAQSLPAGARS